MTSKVETAPLKKLFSSSATSLPFYSNLSPSTSFILRRWLQLLEKKGFTDFQSNLLSDKTEVFSLLKKVFSLFFVESATIVFLLARLLGVERRMIRMMCGVRLVDRVSSDVIRDRKGVLVKIEDMVRREGPLQRTLFLDKNSQSRVHYW